MAQNPDFRSTASHASNVSSIAAAPSTPSSLKVISLDSSASNPLTNPQTRSCYAAIITIRKQINVCSLPDLELEMLQFLDRWKFPNVTANRYGTCWLFKIPSASYEPGCSSCILHIFLTFLIFVAVFVRLIILKLLL